MAYFFITTDSGCDLSFDFCKSIDVIPLMVRYSVGDETFIDDMTPEGTKRFYDKMREGSLPHTTQLNISDFYELWRKLAADGTPIVHISMSSGISGTYNNALKARDMVLEEYPDVEIHVVDSLVTSLGTGAMCIQAAQMREQGKTPAETAAWFTEHSHNLHAIFTTSDLTYMYKGGRVSRVGMIVVHALGIWPILHVDTNGELKVFEKARGKAATFSKVEKIVGELAIDPQEQTLYISHSDSLEDAKIIGEQLKKKFGFKDVFYSYIGAIIGTHTGPGLVSIFFYGKERAEKSERALEVG